MKNIFKKTHSNGAVTYKVRFRKTQDYKTFETFNITFDDLAAAEAWVLKNKPIFNTNPGNLHIWLAGLKKEAAEKGEYVIRSGRRELMRDHIILTRPARL
jgi:hypothetical protein